MSDLTVAAETGEVFEVSASDIQDDITITTDEDGNGKITGTLKWLPTGNAITDVWGAGNFLTLKFSDIDDAATSVKVGLQPSMGSGLVELINDPDKNGVFKIANTDQRFKVVQSDGTHKNVQIFDLSGLTLEAAE